LLHSNVTIPALGNRPPVRALRYEENLMASGDLPTHIAEIELGARHGGGMGMVAAHRREIPGSGRCSRRRAHSGGSTLYDD
jgi:hypothetical protein